MEENTITNNERIDSPPPTINAFQFMMNRRHKIIGSNSPGKEKKSPIKSPEIFEKERKKLKKRQMIFENWAEEKGKTKRKQADEVQEKYINKTLHKRAKRLKTMLNISYCSNSDTEVSTFKKKSSKNENDDSINDNQDTDESKIINFNSTSLLNNTNVLKQETLEKKSKSVTDIDSKENIYICDSYESDTDEIFSKKRTSKSIIQSVSDKSNEDKKENFNRRNWRMKIKLIDKASDQTAEANNKDQIMIIDSENEIIHTSEKKQIKLAPIFLRQETKKKALNAVTAQNNFLQSGIPEKLKKIITLSKSFSENNNYYNSFPTISHVQQKSNELIWNLPTVLLNLTEETTFNCFNLLNNKMEVGTFSNCEEINRNCNPVFSKVTNLKEMIQKLKKDYVDYPIYRTFRILHRKYEKYFVQIRTNETQLKLSTKRKRGRKKKIRNVKESAQNKSSSLNESTYLDSLMWTEKYKPESQEEIIGNYVAVTELKLWLQSWVNYSINQKSNKRTHLDSSSSDDFCSDSTNVNSENFLQNLIVIIGPHGCGKTSSVYALCNELKINVIEINASSRRSGKKILTELQEATKSHQVQNTDSKSQTSFFQKKDNSKTNEELNKKFSLLLIEEVDIVFEDQDDGFISAIITLATSSKRPIILTSTDKHSIYLQKIISQYTVIYFNSLSTRILSPYLQILSLIEGIKFPNTKIDKLVQWNKGDVRKIILELQFWIQSEDPTYKLPEFDTSKLEYEDFGIEEEDKTNISWINQSMEANNIISDFSDNNKFILPSPINLNVIWHNIPSLLCFKSNNLLTNNENDFIIRKNLKDIAKVLDTLSFGDILFRKYDIYSEHEPIYNYWQKNPENSLSRNENFSTYDSNKDISLEIIHWLSENSLKQCSNLINNQNLFNNISYFDELKYRTKRHKIMKTVLNAVPTNCILDRRAICEDYQTILRTISRTENERFNKNSKRNSRFYHYLKNFNIHLNDSSLSILSNTFCYQ